MNFSPQGQPHWKPFIKATKLTPKMVKKIIHGQEVWVKVYPPRWAAGDKREKKRLGLK